MTYCECSFPAPSQTLGKCGRCLRYTDDGFEDDPGACGYCGLPPQDRCPVVGVPCEVGGVMAVADA